MSTEDRDDMATSRELLARLDERTERLDRDIRQMMAGTRAHGEAMEKKIEALESSFRDEMASLNAVISLNDKRSTKALDMAERHEKWFEWGVRIVLAAVIVSLLGLVLVT